jgi:tetratricopeptide (TPR) repeat protein
VLREAGQPPAQAADTDSPSKYSRQQVRRLLVLSERVLRSWERQQLIPEQKEYSFTDLLLLKTIVRLRKDRVPTQRIRRSLVAIRERLKSGGSDLLSHIRVFSHGHNVRVQFGKQQMEPISGQLLFDFDENEISKLLQLPKTGRNSEKTAELFRSKMEADYWFERGLELERRGAPIEQIIGAYEKAVELDPQAAGALVNLGTIYFNGHAWADAEQQYLRAIEVDPNYPLAHFNLGNLYDERGDHSSALTHYQSALRLFPNYADAHYNIALLYQNKGDVLCAVRHWKAYLKLDYSSPWSEIARRELGRLEGLTVVPGTRSLRLARVDPDAV